MPEVTDSTSTMVDISEKENNSTPVNQNDNSFISPQRKLRRSNRHSNGEIMQTPGQKRQRSHEIEDTTTPKKIKVVEDRNNILKSESGNGDKNKNIIENINQIDGNMRDDQNDVDISPDKLSPQNDNAILDKEAFEGLTKNNNHTKNNNSIDKDKSEPDENVPVIEVNNDKCNLCGQYLENSDLIYYQGHPQNAVEEFVALINDKLVLASGDEGDISERPQTNITGFSIFDKEGHLCPIDAGLIESDVRIYMSGYLKSICCDTLDIDDESVPVKDVGPIIEWYIHGFDGGMKNCITLSTEYGEYNLLKPSADYTPLMNNIYEKIYISKVVVEYLEENYFLQPTYEDLLDVVRQGVIPELGDMKMTEEMLHKHAQFICDQVESLEAEEDEEPLVNLPCIREIIKLMGIKFSKRRLRTKINYKKAEKKAWTKATTTPLVRKTFESFFTDQLDKANKDLVLRRKRCGICEACQLPDCGECNACRAMAKFGGHGRTKKACVRRNCSYMAVEQGEESEPDDDDEGILPTQDNDKIEDPVPVKLTGSGSRKIIWPEEPVKVDATKTYFTSVSINGEELNNGDYVIVETSLSNTPSLVARIVYMWKEKIKPDSGYFHGEVFIRASDTILGEVGDPREVYLGDRCCHGAPLSSVLRKAHVQRKEVPKDWFRLGGKEVDDDHLDDDGKTYFFEKYYDRFLARFEDLPEDPACPNEMRKHRFCPSCERKTRSDCKNIPKVVDKLAHNSEHVPETDRSEWTLVRWRDHDYKKGCGVFLKPDTFQFPTTGDDDGPRAKLEKVDESVYTEYYRKSDNNMRGSNADTGDPFCVGHVVAVTARGEGPLVSPQDIYLKVTVMRRPENTNRPFPHNEDLNVLYWSDEVREVPFAAVTGPCHLYYERNAPDRRRLDADPTAFYFREAYDPVAETFASVPPHAQEVGRHDRGKGKGKGKGKGRAASPARKVRPPRPLRALDVFAGCGGLSHGLHEAGAADSRWAVENAAAAARAYKLNNPACAVLTDDCNELLRRALAGDRAGPSLPEPGEVELLCGGPPCQGFSGMNRFNSREYSNFKNSLVASYLSYCDYFRPKYFVLENVRNFVAFKRGMVLKLTLRALLAMGYQCTFGVLQAGRYGVPQTRRRLIVLAAAPGLVLPRYPEPTHVFSRRACSLAVTVDGKRFGAEARGEHAAPRRTCTIADAMSDLPEISNGAHRLEMEYGSMPRTHFQRLVRGGDERAKLRDHICKNMAPLIQARMCRIPTVPGSDWRDLPNISVTLADGSKCKVLQYRYEDKKNGRSSMGSVRGVCACAAGEACGRADKQENTLIPWCLPHTANRHNNWAGLYGRIAWDGYFSTTVTDPEPMGKQGRVLHPEQHRVVSVRECARSQGFPDTYLFAGSVQDKHRQIGNAVPPPLGAALGREIIKALSASNV